MNERMTLLGLGAIGAVLAVAFAASKGTQTTQGVVFQAPSDASVASVENAASSEISSVNALAQQRSQTAASTILGLASLQEQLRLGTLAAQSTNLQTLNQTSQVALQQAGSVHATDVAGAVANYAEMISGQNSTNQMTSANYQADVSATATNHASDNALTAAIASIQAQLQSSAITANANIQEAASAGSAATAISNNQTTQAQAAAGASKTGAIFGAIGNIAKAFSGA